jgi:tetratricopeptide (TPR) repeat protein
VDWQQAVYWNHVKRGDILLQHRRQDDALRDYQESLIVGRNLIEVDPNTVDMPLNLAETSAKAADILLTQHNFAKVQDIAADNLAIADRLAGINPTSPGPPQLRWLSYMLHGDVEWQEERQLDGAFEAYRNGLAQINLLHPLEDTFVKAFKEIRSSDAAGKLSTAGRFTPASELKTRWEQDLDLSVNRIGSLAYGFLKNRKVSQALNAADLAISLAPDKIWINANRAHALMFLGRLQEAKAVYLRYRGAKNVQSDKDWDTVILDDFAELRKAGLAHPLMGEIERLFTQQAQR